MDRTGVKESVAYCGLICRLCFLAEHCDGCKSVNNACDRNRSDQGCFQKNCCERHGYEGCWQCGELYACTEGIYSAGELSKVKAFAICIREDGIDSFVSDILSNMERGLNPEKGKDYDGRPIHTVLSMIRGR